MTFDIPHMIATALIIAAIVYAMNHMPQVDGMTRGRKTLLTFVALFVALLILNTVWPYGGPA